MVASPQDFRQFLPTSVFSADELTAISQRIIASGELGRSKIYAKLLNYLVDCSISAKSPKEIEIAIDVMGRESDFDVSKDSLVRVYIHNLRKKLDSFYDKYGRDDDYRITIPKGQYTIAVYPNKKELLLQDSISTEQPKYTGTLVGLIAVMCLLLAINIIYLRSLTTDTNIDTDPYRKIRQTPFWTALLDDDAPILIVMGDYYIFGELGQDGNVKRMVREFHINSPRDLGINIINNPELNRKVKNLDLTYLPSAAAFALKDLLPVIQPTEKQIEITMMSELDTTDIKSRHVIYIGYVSALDKLQDLVFASSGLMVGSTYDELVNVETNTHYFSNAGLRGNNESFVDYGLFSTFPTPDGNQILIIAGTRDAGLMHTAQVLSSPVRLETLNTISDEDAMSGPPSLEVLYEVFGFDQTNFDAMLVYNNLLDYKQIWGGELIDIRHQSAAKQ